MMLLLLLILASGSRPPGTHTTISLRRTACYGSCPVYAVTMTDDGTVSYNGVEHVRVSGTHTWKIDPARVRAVADEMVKDGFFDLQDSYSSPLSDNPTVYTALSRDGRTKEVRDYISGPIALKEIEARIDAVSGAKGAAEVSGAVIREMQKAGWRATDAQAERWLWDAAHDGDADVLGALIAAGANASAAHDDGTTLLMAAARSGDADCVRLLTAAGADPTSRNRDGLNAADMVRSAMNPEPAVPRSPAPGPRVVHATGRPPQYELILRLLTNE